jgi:glycosyltransferase involved in cell wall biosynthesis/O-antigen/teichoic acid export membrane protein
VPVVEAPRVTPQEDSAAILVPPDGARPEPPRGAGRRLVSGILAGGGWSFVVATAGVNGLNFLFHVVISRQLGPSYYGALGALLNVISILSVPLGAVQLAVTQAIVARKRGPAPLRSLVGRAAVAGLAAMVAFWVVSPVIENFLNIHSPAALLVLGAWLPLAVVGAVLQGALMGEIRFVPVSIATFLGGGALRLAIGVTLVSTGFGLEGAVAATVVGQAVTTGVLLVVARHNVLSTGPLAVRISLRDATLSVAALAGYTALTGVDTLLARHFLAPAAAGRYAAAAVAGHIAMFLPGALVMVAFPRLVSDGGVGKASRKVLVEALAFVTVIGLATVAVLALAPGLVVRLLFGQSYLAAASVVGILGLASAFFGLIALLTYFHIARRSYVALFSWVGIALVSALVSFLHGGPATIALSMLAASAVVLVGVTVPAAAALLRSLSEDAAREVEVIALPPPELDLTLVLPFYNPGSRLATHVREVVATLDAEGISYEVIAVSDGSTDGSVGTLGGLEHVQVLEIPENQGKGAALRLGLTHGRGFYLGFIDGDGDLPAAQLHHFVEAIREGRPDIVLGSKVDPGSEVVYPPLRRLYSFGYQQLNRILFKLDVRDTQTGVKVVRRETLAAVLPRMLEKRFAFDLELLVVAKRLGYRGIVELPVQIQQRFTSTISLRAVFDMLLDTAAIFYRARLLGFYGPVQPTHAGTASAAAPDRVDMTPAAADPAEAPALSRSSARSRLRILVFSWRDLAHPLSGGAEVWTHEVMQGWRDQGHEVTLFCAAVEGHPEDELSDDGVRIIRRGSRYSVYREARAFYEREGRGKFDLVVDQVNTRPFDCPRYVKDTKVVAVIHQVAREVWFYEMPFPLALLGRFVLEPLWLKKYRNVTTATLSPSSRESLEGMGLRDVTVVPAGHRSRPCPAVPKESSPTLLYVGRLSSNKRPDHVVRAFAAAREQVPGAQLWIVGRGPEESFLRQHAGEGVTFFGFVDQETRQLLMARAHALVMTSVREGWGLTVTEAAEVGTPTIGYAVAGLVDSVRSSGGYVVRPSVESLAAELAKVLPRLADGSERPDVSPGGVIGWPVAAERLLAVALGPPSPATSGRPSQIAVGGRQAPLLERRRAVPPGTREPVRRRLAVGERSPALARVRIAAAGVGVAALAATAFGSGWPGFSGATADVALVALFVAALLLVGETRLLGRQHPGWLPIEGSRSQWRAAVVLAGACAFAAAQSWFVSGTVIAGGDQIPPIGLSWLGRLFAPWTWTGDNLGAPSTLNENLPWAVVLWTVHSLGGSPALAQRVFMTLLFTGAAAAAVALAKMLGLRPAAAAIAGLAFVFNPAVVSEVGTNPVYLAAMVLLPAMPAIVIAVARGRIRARTGAVLLGCCGPLLGFVYQQPTLVLMTAMLIMLAVLLAYFTGGRNSLRSACRVVALGGALLAGVSAYWVVPAVVQLPYIASTQLGSISSWLFTEGRATTANAFWLNTAWGWRYTEYVPFAPAYSRPPLSLFVYALPIVAFGALLLPASRIRGDVGARRLRITALISLVALFLVLITTGTNFPGSIVFDRLYSLPLGWILREPDHYLVGCGLAYAVLAGLTADAVARGAFADPIVDLLIARRPRRLALAGLCVAGVLVPGYPLATGQIVPQTRPVLPPDHVTVPSYWPEMASVVDSQSGDGAVLPADDFYQMPYKWGYYGSDAAFLADQMTRDTLNPSPQSYDVVQPQLLQTVDQVDFAILAHDWLLTADLLDALRTPYLLVREDIASNFPGRHITNPVSLATALTSDPDVQQVAKTGPLLLFRSDSTPGTGLVRSSVVVTSSTRAPDLEVLPLFPDGSELVDRAPEEGLPFFEQVPGIAQWALSADALTTTVGTPHGWTVDVASLGVHPTVAPASDASRVLDGLTASSDGASKSTLSLALTEGSLLEARGPLNDGWGAVGDCAAFNPAGSRRSAKVIPEVGPGGTSALLLQASVSDSSCVFRPLHAGGAALVVSFEYRDLSLGDAAMCLWDNSTRTCALSPTLTASSSWTQERFAVSVNPADSYSLYLYANVYQSGASVAEEYAGVSVRALRAVPPTLAIIGRPSPSTRTPPVLWALGASAGGPWQAPGAAQPVTVDGLLTGWLVPEGAPRPHPRDVLSEGYKVAAVVSVSSTGALALLLCWGTVVWARRRRRWVTSTPESEGIDVAGASDG